VGTTHHGHSRRFIKSRVFTSFYGPKKNENAHGSETSREKLHVEIMELVGRAD
jgi:hypothetical protein